MNRLVVVLREDHPVFQQGDVIAVLPEGRDLGPREKEDDLFGVVGVKGARYEVLRHLVQRDVDEETDVVTGERRITAMRGGAFGLDVAGLPSALRDRLLQKRELLTNAETLNHHMMDRRGNVPVTLPNLPEVAGG